MAGAPCLGRCWLLGLCLARGVLSQDPVADDPNTDMTDNVLLQGPPDPFVDNASSDVKTADSLLAILPQPKSSIERLSKAVGISDTSGADALAAEADSLVPTASAETDAVQQDESADDLAQDGRQAAAAVLKPSPEKARAERIAHHEINSQHKFMNDAGAFNIAKDEISRMRAEGAAADIEKAVASKQQAEKKAAYLLAVADGYRKQQAEAMKEAEYSASKAARRAAAQFRAEHMRKARLLEARSWNASQHATKMRAAADAAVQSAFAGLKNVQSS